MKRKLDLRTGKPVWFAYPAPRISAPELSRDIKADVLVVGLGISGAMICETLTFQGLNVIGVDRRGPLRGSTPATTALVQFEIDVPMTKLSRRIGRANAVRAWRRSRLALSNLSDRIAHLDIRCAAAFRPSLLLASNETNASELREEALARNAAGLRSTYLTATNLRDDFGLKRAGSILSHGNLVLDPRKLAAGLLNIARNRGAQFFGNTEISGLQTSRNEILAKTSQGPTVRCKAVVLATGYEMLDIVPMAKHKIISTWAMATRPQPRAIWPQAALIWEASDPYLYLRATVDGRIICGGEDEDFIDEERRDNLIDKKTATLQRKLRNLLPDVDCEADYAWTGSFGTTETGLPYIGAVPRHPNVFAVMGYGGNGITYAQLASELVATAIAGRTDDDADLFELKN